LVLGALWLAAFSAAGQIASAATLPLQTQALTAQTTNVAMCDSDVTLTPVEVLGVTTSVSVSNISTDCFGWTLKVQVTNSADTPLMGGALSTVVDQTTETFLSLSVGQFPGPNHYYWVFDPP
jgi:hypothetical protein